MKKKKFALDNLKVKSFVTDESPSDAQTIKGGRAKVSELSICVPIETQNQRTVCFCLATYDRNCGSQIIACNSRNVICNTGPLIC